jgi:flavin-dependent dehydrogenase
VTDLLVAGGGPAGLATALYARRAGLTVTVVEPREPPVDKACGEGLMPSAVAALEELGMSVGGWPFHGIRYCDGRRTAVAHFRHGMGRGVRRTDLHSKMWRAVEASGADIVPGRIEAVRQTGDAVHAGGLRARYLVAADGLHSPVRRQLGLATTPSRHRRWGLRAHFASPPWASEVEVHWALSGEAYVTPIGPDCVGVAVLGGRSGRFGERLAAFAELAERLAGAPMGPVRAAGPLRQDVRARVAGRVLLVGDAAGYVDALTGEGLSIAFASARALVQRVRADDPTRYESDYRRITRRYRLLTTALVGATRPEAVRRGVVPLAKRAPWLFTAAVNQLAR